MQKVLAFVFMLLLIMSPAVAQEKKTVPKAPLEVVTKAWPKPYSISHNIVFVVDASSTINRYPIIQRKFEKGWDFLVRQFAADDLYFRVYVFNDPHKERRTKWVDAGGPQGQKQFLRAKKYIQANTGVYSWGLRAIRMAMREKNPLDKNPVTARTLTIVLFTDGGLTEAAEGYDHSEEEILKSPLKNHIYGKTSSFNVINKMIALEQERRKANGLDMATIVTIGFENREADREYGLSVKQRDPVCQWWLEQLGKKYHGGNFLVRRRLR
jgi:hypothetical protein